MRVGAFVGAGWVALCLLGCQEKTGAESGTPSGGTASSRGGDPIEGSRFFCRAVKVPTATTHSSLNVRGGEPIYYYGECFPSEARCRSRANDLCFEQPVAWCYKEIVLGTKDTLYTLCLSNAHVCADWRNTRMADMGERIKSDCEMTTSAQFME